MNSSCSVDKHPNLRPSPNHNDSKWASQFRQHGITAAALEKAKKNIIVEYYEYFREISLIALIFTRFVKNTEPESGAREGEETGRSGRNFETDVFV